MPHADHVFHDVNHTDVSVKSSAEHDVRGAVTQHAGASSMDVVWKGMVVLAGIYVFFVTERLIALCRTPLRRRDFDKVISI